MPTFVANGTVISQEAFANQFANWVATTQNGIIPPTISIVIGANVTLIEANAFSQINASNVNATISFENPETTLNIEANAFAGFPITSLTIPENTTLSPNSLSGINTLITLDLRNVTTQLSAGSVDLTRTSTLRLGIYMPSSSSVVYAPNAVVLPPSGINPETGLTESTTLLFSTVPSVDILNQLCVVPPSATKISFGIDFLTSSNTSQDQINALVNALSVGGVPPTGVDYNNVDSSVNSGNNNSVSLDQFVGNSFNYIKLSTTECVLTGYNSVVASSALLPIPNKITAEGETLSVIGIASSILINGSRVTDTYFIIDNYYHVPYYASNNATATPLFALIKSNGVSSAVVSPTLVCNGSYIISPEGQLVISADANAYVQGYAAGASSLSSLLNTSGSFYDINSQTIIGAIKASSNSFKITIKALINQSDNEYIHGGFQNLTTLKNVDFTNKANEAITTWNAYSSAASNSTVANTTLINLISQIRQTQLVITQPNPPIVFPSVTQSITSELSAVSTSNPNSVLTNVNILNMKYANLYVPYLTGPTNSVSKFISDVLAVADGNNILQKPTRDAFLNFQTTFNSQVGLLNEKIAAIQPLVNSYFSSRFQLGNNTFKDCSAITTLKSFARMRNLVKINENAFNGCISISDNLSIPVNVETIGRSAFRSCGITSLVLQDAVALRTIESYAFYSCSSIVGNLSFSSVTYNNNRHVETIGDYAFSNCSNLTSHLYFPLGLKSLGVGAFKGCSNLNGTIVFPQNQFFTTISESAFEDCYRLTGVSNNTGTSSGLQYLPGSPSYNLRGSNTIPTGLNIPSNVQTIGPSAFKGCTAFIGALNLSDQLVTMGESAFQGCAGFTSLKLPAQQLVTSIPYNCFKGCIGLTNLEIPSNIQYIMDGAFQGCVNISGKIDVSNLRGIYNDAFNGCIKLSGILVLGMKLTTIGDRAFYGCPLLTSVTFLGVPPSNLKNVVTIFGLDFPNTIPFYVNVFQDNGWVPINAQGVSPLSINSVFRSHDSSPASSKSRVIMSFIDFTFAPLSFPTVRELNMIKCDPASFLMWDNSGQSGVNTPIDPANEGVKEWHDIYMPGSLKGVDLTSAQDAVSAAWTAERETKLQTIVNQYASSLNKSGYAALHATMTAGSAIHGNNLHINAGPSQNGINLVSLLSPTGITAADNTYGVHSTGTGSAQVDTLSFGTTLGSPSVLAISVGSHAQYYISGSTTNPALHAKYAKKVIAVDSLGVISIAPINVIETVVTSANNPASTMTGYTIQTATNMLYLNDLLAPMGAYYVASVTGATTYLNKLLYVDDKSIISLPENEVTTVVPVANSTASSIAGVYSMSTVAGAGNTGHVLNVGNGAAAVPVNAGTYYIKLSDVSQFNNAVVHVSNGGGMSLNVTGLTGVAHTLQNLTTAFCANSIPIYPTDRDSDLLTNFMNSEYVLVTSASQQAIDSLYTANASVNGTVTHINRAVTNPTNALLLSDTLKSSVANTLASHSAQNTAIADISQYYGSTYRAAKNNLDAGFKSLLSVQKSALDAIDIFIKNSIYDNATNLTNNSLDYITSELNNYMATYATYQQANSQLWTTTQYMVNLNMGYTSFSRVKKNLADAAARLISNWLATTENGNTWSELMNSNAISTFISNVIVPANTVNGVNPYHAFLNSHPVPTREQVRAAIIAYETTVAEHGINAHNVAVTAAGDAYLAAYPNATIYDKAAVATPSVTVYEYYYASQYAGNFKTYFNGLVNTFNSRVSAVSSKLKAVEHASKSASESVNSVYSTLNTETVIANSNALNAANIINKHLNAAQVRHRMLDLYNVVLANKTGSNPELPTFDNSPEYEKSWFAQRVDNYSNASIGSTPLTTARVMTEYNAAYDVFKVKKMNYVYAMTNAYFANNPPISAVVAGSVGIPQALVRIYVFKCLSNITSFVLADLPPFVSTVANQFTAYVRRRDAALAGVNAEAKASALLAHNQSEVVNAENGLKNAAIEYGMALYNMYLTVIDFAIADLMGNRSSVAANAFQINMHNYRYPTTWHSPSEYLPALKSAIFSQVYFTSIVEPTIPYALMVSTATGALSLYDIFNRGFTIANNSADLTIVPIETYSSTVGNVPDAFTIPELQYATNLRTVNVSDLTKALADTAIISEYNITSLDSTSTQAVNSQLSIVSGMYYITIDGWGYYGYEQSSQLNNSLVKLAPNETAVFLYKGTGNLGMVPPVGLVTPTNQTDYNTFFCDDAEYIVFIQADPEVADGGKIFNMYTWDSYGQNSGKLIFTGTISKMGVIVTKTVSGCFQLQEGISSVKLIGDLILSNTIKTVGVNAFSNCNAIASLTFSKGTSSVKVKDSAFANCTGLIAIDLDSTISSVGRSAFLNCTGAILLKLSTNPAFTVVDHFTFLGCNKISNNLIVPSNVNQINIQSFSGCKLLTCQQLNGDTTYLPENFNKIGFGAFEGCTALSGALNFNNIIVNRTTVSSVQFIGSSAFFGCNGLNGTVSFPNNASYRNILPYTFASSSAPFTRKPVPVGQNVLPMQLKGMLDFSNVYVERICENAFYKCTALTGITLSTIISEIGNNAFKLCNGLLGTLVLPAFVKRVGDSAFEGCSNLLGLNIISTTVSETATTAWLSIGASAFKDCEMLTNSTSTGGIIIPNTVNKLGDFAFSGCANIPSVSIGSGLISPGAFGKGMFINCTKLARVTMAFSFLSKNGAGSVVSGADDNTNLSFTGCAALGVLPNTVNPKGNIIIQPGTTDWVSQRAPFFNRLMVVVTNKNIIFYMNEFNTEVITLTPIQVSAISQSVPLTDAQATIYLRASDLRKVFSVSTDSYLNNGGLDLGEMYFVSPEHIPFFNVSNAQVVQGNIEAYNAAPYEQLVKDDVLRHQSSAIFGSADWTTIFMNGNEIKENLVASSGLIPSIPDGEVGTNSVNAGIFYNIIQLLNRIGYTTTNQTNQLMTKSTYPPNALNKWWGLTDSIEPEQGNICKKLFNLIQKMDPERINSMVRTGATPMNLPLLSGDQFVFVLKIKKKDVQLTINSNPISIDERTYLIKIILTEDFDSGSSQFDDHNVALYSKSLLNKNIIPVDSGYSAEHAYSNYDVYVVSPNEQASSSTTTTTNYYSKVTQNSTYEPVKPPQNVIGIPGWYFPSSVQSTRLDFTPTATNLKYYDLRYLSANLYFPNSWSSNTQLPNINNFPTWNVTFTNGTNTIVLTYYAKFLTRTGDVLDFLGQKNRFNYNNPHIQLLAPFEASTESMPNGKYNELIGLLSGADANNHTGNVSFISETNILSQQSNVNVVNGLHQWTEAPSIGPFTYPSIRRNFQCIPMPTNAALNGPVVPPQLVAPDTQYTISKITLDINIQRSITFVTNVIVKSVEIVTKKYETFYLAPYEI